MIVTSERLNIFKKCFPQSKVMALVKDGKGIYAWESLYTDGKWSTQQMYDFGFSRRFILVRV
jgi:hypothetical protein